MEAFDVGMILSSPELFLLMRIQNLAPPEELPLPDDGAEEAFEGLEAAGLLIRDERHLAVDKAVAKMIKAVCQREWALTLESIARSQTAFYGDGLCVTAERLGEQRWLITPFPSARNALNTMAAELADEQDPQRAQFAGAAQRFELTLPAQEMRAFLEDALTRTGEG